MFQDSNKELLDMKQAKSNTVITLVVLFAIRRLLTPYWIICRKAHLRGKKCPMWAQCVFSQLKSTYFSIKGIKRVTLVHTLYAPELATV